MKSKILIISFLLLIGVNSHGGNGYGHEEKCETAYTTTTIYDPAPTPSTFMYTKTEVVPGDSAQVVTKTVEKQGSIEIVTSIESGITKVITIYSATTKYFGATTTKTSTTTLTTYPYATATEVIAESIIIFVKGTLTVTYPPPAITIKSLSRYTGAPTSLWLSVI